MMFFGDLEEVISPQKKLEEYSPIVTELVEKIRLLSSPLKGKRIVHLNATAVGGGVAEMLKSIVPLQRDIGLLSRWFVLPANESFFEVTKKIHNFLQGKEGELTRAEKKLYLDYNKYIAGLLAKVKADILLVHDPQPAACLNFLDGRKPLVCIWRCHIDTSVPNPLAWNFLLPFLKIYDKAVFTMADFTNSNFPKEKIEIITPVIDPLCQKNKAMTKTQAKAYLKRFGISPDKPLITQISRFDPWKDPLGVIDAFRLAKKKIANLQLAMVAQMANDDPEGERVYQKVKEYAAGEEGIFLFVNLPQNDKAVNAFQVASDIVLQKSIKEGFGLTVAEAMWKRAVVIGGNVGGIKLQIKDGENGFLVNSSNQAAQKIIFLLKNPKKKKQMAQKAHLWVRQHYLLPHKIFNYLTLFDRLLLQKRLYLPLPSSFLPHKKPLYKKFLE